MASENPGQAESPSSQAIMALVLGILSIATCCGVLGPIAWYVGSQELKAIRQARSPAAGEALAKTGLVLGILGTLVMIMFQCWLFFLGGLAMLSAWFSA